ncbi:hypothetical protein [Arcobacter roscoffensis]|uniref:Uncharacterized protein n=1 Tax=Arcobacter roscoffensis TaxID=2961520 RepID=A0ABY5E3Z9_9BACT|nr:hypothetical protein [Arcobacter roscoffensis]UTJ06282.1 hypothetical protein NJU99_13655 [Arcobacter roscoffensis]
MEHGQVIKIGGRPINTPSTAPEAFCWDATKIETGFGIYDGKRYKSETLIGDQSAADWFALETKEVYGENHYGSYVWVRVHGIPQNQPVVKLGYKEGVLVEVKNIRSYSGEILNGKEYKFFIRHIPVSQASTVSDIDISGSLDIYDGATLKDVTYIK